MNTNPNGPQSGPMIGNYQLTAKIGEGGMGQVFSAVDTMLERRVAIKALHSHLTQDADRLQRFRTEAVTLARLNHPNIATLYNFFEANGSYFMVMEFVDGETFESLVRRLGAIPVPQALALFSQALQGLEHAHAKQVVHRDIKPSNLMLDTGGTVKITDFGIARVAGSGRLTQTGKLIGTLEYMSPEQVRGLEQDARSDIYSLGILLYEIITGKMPFSATSDFELMRAHLEVPPTPVRDFAVHIPPALEAAIMKALAKDPQFRFQNAREFRNALEAVLQSLPAPVAPAPIVPAPGETRMADVPVAPVATPPASTPPLSPPTTVAPQPTPVSPPTTVAPMPTTEAPRPQMPQAPPMQVPVMPPPMQPQVRTPEIARPAAKKFNPAILAGVGGVLLLAIGGFAALRPRAPEPTPIAVENTTTRPVTNRADDTPRTNPPDERQSAPQADVVLPREPQTAPERDITDVEVPDFIPGLSPTPTSAPRVVRPVERPSEPVRVQPEKPRTVKRAAPRRVVREPRVETREPRVRRRVVRAAPAKPRRVVREAPRRRVAKVVRRAPVRKAPRRVVSRPARRPSGGGGEDALLRSIVKGN